MAEVPKPADEEFESRLAWTPPGSWTSGVAPARPPRRRVVRAEPAPAPEGVNGADDPLEEIRRVVLELRDRLDALEDLVASTGLDQLTDALAVVHRELGTGLRGIREELAGQDRGARRRDVPTGEQLDHLVDEMAQLRRRIALRASSGAASLADADVERIAEEVVARLAGLTPPSGRRRRRPSAE